MWKMCHMSARKLFFYSSAISCQEWVNDAAFKNIVHFKVCDIMHRFQGHQPLCSVFVFYRLADYYQLHHYNGKLYSKKIISTCKLYIIKVNETFRIYIVSCRCSLSWVSRSRISRNPLEFIVFCYYFFKGQMCLVLDDSGMMDVGNIFTSPATLWQHKNTPGVKNSSKLTGGKCHHKRKRRKFSLCSVLHIWESRIGSHGAQMMNHAGGWLFCLLLSCFFQKLLCYLCSDMTVAWNNKLN